MALLVMEPSVNDRVVRLAAQAAATVFGLTTDEVMGKTKEQPAAFARQVAWWLLSDVLDWSSQRIGRLSERHHATIAHGFKTVEDRLSTEKRTQERVIMARAMFLRGVTEYSRM